MPKLVKIGFTDRDPHTRAKELSSFTGVPGNFEIVCSWLVSDASEVEGLIHAELSALRRTGEFFEISPEDAKEMVKCFLIKQGTIDPDGLSYQAKQLIEKEKEKARKEEIRRLKNIDRRDLEYAVRGIYDQLVTLNLLSSRIADQESAPRGIFSFLSSPDPKIRDLAFRNAFKKKRQDLADRLGLAWIGSTPPPLPISYANDYIFQIPGGTYGPNYRIPAGTTIVSSTDWIVTAEGIENPSTHETFNWGMYSGYTRREFDSRLHPFSFTVIRKDLRVIVGMMKKINQKNP